MAKYRSNVERGRIALMWFLWPPLNAVNVQLSVPRDDQDTANPVVTKLTTTIRLRFDVRSTAYQRSLFVKVVVT